jgi:integrase
LWRKCLGLRVSEILAIQWRDINFGELTMRVTRGVVDGVVDEVKTEYSEDDLPLDPDLATVLLSWKERCPKSEDGWMSNPAGLYPSGWTKTQPRRYRLAHLPPHLSLVARFGWHFDGSAAEANASRSDCNHHERLWRRHDGIEAHSQ